MNVTQSYYYCAANHVNCVCMCLWEFFVLFLFLSFSDVVPSCGLLIVLTVALFSPVGWCVSQPPVSRNNCSEIFYPYKNQYYHRIMHNTHNWDWASIDGVRSYILFTSSIKNWQVTKVGTESWVIVLLFSFFDELSLNLNHDFAKSVDLHLYSASNETE